ncbi:hypothetical protein V9T40_008996 [Parthenolecanium corni]|uniref:Transposase n=1 Tax=Parthenolecanium corni TaxID=536013 RepID=A0AAN9TRQ6_9HEMI
MSEVRVHPSVAQRIIIKFLVNENVSANEIYARLMVQFPDDLLLKRSQFYKWVKAFKEGRERVENRPHNRRPRTSVKQDNIDRVEQLILEDRRTTIKEMAEEVGISVGSIETIIHKHLRYRKVSARWVPHLLNFDQKFTREEICERLLARYDAEGDDFIKKIFTTDETWVHYYTPLSKRATMEWRKKNEGAPVKAKRVPSAGKILCTVFWDMRGVLYVDFLRTQKTINAVYYSNLLENHVRPAYRSKRRDIPIRSAILLHDNARPHTAEHTRTCLAKLRWETLEHPPYSPDLSPCDFYLFGPLKEALGGEQFQNDDDVENFVREWLDSQSHSFYERGMRMLPHRWRKCVDIRGDYLEKV